MAFQSCSDVFCGNLMCRFLTFGSCKPLADRSKADWSAALTWWRQILTLELLKWTVCEVVLRVLCFVWCQPAPFFSTRNKSDETTSGTWLEIVKSIPLPFRPKPGSTRGHRALRIKGGARGRPNSLFCLCPHAKPSDKHQRPSLNLI